MLIYEKNFLKLNELLNGDLLKFASGEITYRKIRSAGFMDLVIEWIGDNSVSIAHYFESNGDPVQDPEMVLLVHPQLEMVESLYIQTLFGIREVYTDANRTHYYPLERKEQNSFLEMWLNNLKDQGFNNPHEDSKEETVC